MNGSLQKFYLNFIRKVSDKHKQNFSSFGIEVVFQLLFKKVKQLVEEISHFKGNLRLESQKFECT